MYYIYILQFYINTSHMTSANGKKCLFLRNSRRKRSESENVSFSNDIRLLSLF